MPLTRAWRSGLERRSHPALPSRPAAGQAVARYGSPAPARASGSTPRSASFPRPSARARARIDRFATHQPRPEHARPQGRGTRTDAGTGLLEEEPLASGVRGLVDGVREALADGAVGQADRLTTLALLEQAGREGCLRRADAEKIPDGLLAELDDGWASASGGWWAFARSAHGSPHLCCRDDGRYGTSAWLLGWRTGLDDVVPLYAEFVRNAKDGATPFDPTLRNMDREHDPQWHDEWATTVLALHKRLRDWGG